MRGCEMLHEHYIIMPCSLCSNFLHGYWRIMWTLIQDQRTELVRENHRKKIHGQKTDGDRLKSSLKLTEKERNWLWKKTDRKRYSEIETVRHRPQWIIIGREKKEKLGMKAPLREKEAFTSRPIQRDRMVRLCGRSIYIHNHSTLTEPNTLWRPCWSWDGCGWLRVVASHRNNDFS